jgi:hypothetical protein
MQGITVLMEVQLDLLSLQALQAVPVLRDSTVHPVRHLRQHALLEPMSTHRMQVLASLAQQDTSVLARLLLIHAQLATSVQAGLVPVPPPAPQEHTAPLWVCKASSSAHSAIQVVIANQVA